MNRARHARRPGRGPSLEWRLLKRGKAPTVGAPVDSSSEFVSRRQLAEPKSVHDPCFNSLIDHAG
jgi:hypothetical protein